MLAKFSVGTRQWASNGCPDDDTGRSELMVATEKKESCEFYWGYHVEFFADLHVLGSNL